MLLVLLSGNVEGGPLKKQFIYKKLCIYSYMFKLQSPSKYSPFDAKHLSRCFFTAQNSFFKINFLKDFIYF